MITKKSYSGPKMPASEQAEEKAEHKAPAKPKKAKSTNDLRKMYKEMSKGKGMKY